MAMNHIDRTDRQLVVGVSELPPSTHYVLGTFDQRQAALRAHPEPRVTEQRLIVQVTTTTVCVRAFALADSAETALDAVTETLKRDREQCRMLEAATPPPTNELGVHDLEIYAPTLLQEHIDVVERERAHVRL
jgi:hypothetical protein